MNITKILSFMLNQKNLNRHFRSLKVHKPIIKRLKTKCYYIVCEVITGSIAQLDSAPAF
jgi:hypothetical protein